MQPPPKLRGFDLLPLQDFHPMDPWRPPDFTMGWHVFCSGTSDLARKGERAISTSAMGEAILAEVEKRLR